MRGPPFLDACTYWLTDWEDGASHRAPRVWPRDLEGKKNSK